MLSIDDRLSIDVNRLFDMSMCVNVDGMCGSDVNLLFDDWSDLLDGGTVSRGKEESSRGRVRRRRLLMSTVVKYAIKVLPSMLTDISSLGFDAGRASTLTLFALAWLDLPISD